MAAKKVKVEAKKFYKSVDGAVVEILRAVKDPEEVKKGIHEGRFVRVPKGHEANLVGTFKWNGDGGWSNFVGGIHDLVEEVEDPTHSEKSSAPE